MLFCNELNCCHAAVGWVMHRRALSHYSLALLLSAYGRSTLPQVITERELCKTSIERMDVTLWCLSGSIGK